VTELKRGAARVNQLILKTADYTISGRRSAEVWPSASDQPLIIALHGGTYSSTYFDISGYSLLDRAAALEIPVLVLDRPGYGHSSPLPASEATIAANAERLDDALGAIWREQGEGRPGIVLIGHSIGGAIAVAIAARQPKWPLLGIAISGVGLASPPEAGAAWASLPNLPMLDLPPEIKDTVMFGPPWTFEEGMPERSRPADASIPRVELLDIVTAWVEDVRSLAAKVTVPLHYRQAEFDRLWIVNQGQISEFGAAFSASPSVDAQLYSSAGHCIDFHKLSAAFQLEQLAFALRCAPPRPAK
jgi:pimeloyl-ACP methyl ester carboxylesterase